MSNPHNQANKDLPTDEYDVLPDVPHVERTPGPHPAPPRPMALRPMPASRPRPLPTEPPVVEPQHNPLSGLMRGLAVLSIVVMLAGQVIAAWAIWMSPDNYDRNLGLKLYGGGFLAAFAFSLLANFTLPPTRERRTKPGTKTASVAVVLALMPIVIAVVAFAVSLAANRNTTAQTNKPSSARQSAWESNAGADGAVKEPSLASGDAKSQAPAETAGGNQHRRQIQPPWSTEALPHALKVGMEFGHRLGIGADGTYGVRRIESIKAGQVTVRETLQDNRGIYFRESRTLTWTDWSAEALSELDESWTLGETFVITPAGTYQCWTYTRTDQEGRASRWCYAKDYPGIIVSMTQQSGYQCIELAQPTTILVNGPSPVHDNQREAAESNIARLIWFGPVYPDEVQWTAYDYYVSNVDDSEDQSNVSHDWKVREAASGTAAPTKDGIAALVNELRRIYPAPRFHVVKSARPSESFESLKKQLAEAGIRRP